MSYYQKYRPRRIEELDLELVRESLKANLKSGKISHAYLFLGPRGAGKTSTARILAQVINCEENRDKSVLEEACGKCQSCVSIQNGSAVDIIEMDAASHRGIDDIRDIRDRVRLSPVSLSKKVYIIDEVHMLTTESFNALLKMLEEPPVHVMFFLCTTEAHKVPETIVSRCVGINFVKASSAEMVRSLNKAVKGENLEVEDGSLEVLAGATDGSFREGHKLLEQVAAAGKKITVDLVMKILGVAGKDSVGRLVEMALRGESGGIVKMIGEMEGSGVKASVLTENLLNLTQKGLEESTKDLNKFAKYVDLSNRLIVAAEKIKYSPIQMLPVEIALLSVAVKVSSVMPQTGERREAVVKKEEQSRVVSSKVEQQTPMESKGEEIEIEDNQVVRDYTGPLASIDRIKDEWNVFLSHFAPENASLAGLLRSSMPTEIQDKYLTLEVFYPFHKSKIEEDSKKKLIEAEMAKQWGPVNLKCVLGSKRGQTTETHTSQPVVEQVQEMKEDTVVKSSSHSGGSVEEIFGV